MPPISATAFYLSFFLFLFLLSTLLSVWLIRYLPPWTRPPPLAWQCVLLHNWNNKFSQWRLSSEPPKIALSELPFPAAAVSFVLWSDEEWEVSVGELRAVHGNPLSLTPATNSPLLNTYFSDMFDLDGNWFVSLLSLAAVANWIHAGRNMLFLQISAMFIWTILISVATKSVAFVLTLCVS